MEQGRIIFPELTEAPAQARVVAFRPRQVKGRLNGDGLAHRLRRDVERQVAHRRRMLAHLQAQAGGSR
jgi:hypothetical protein